MSKVNIRFNIDDYESYIDNYSARSRSLIIQIAAKKHDLENLLAELQDSLLEEGDIVELDHDTHTY